MLVLAPRGRAADPTAAPAREPETKSALPPAVAELTAAATRLADPAHDPAWRDLIRSLQPNKTRQSSFEERRFFPFRKTPIVLKGEIRIVPERGLSLRYLQPEERVMIIDRQGLLVREADGTERAAPADARAQAATTALENVLRFDLAALEKQFEVHGRRNASAWTLAFVPKDPTFASLLGVLIVSGDQATLRRIEMVKSATQRIEIDVTKTVEDVLFTGDTMRRFFR